MAARNPFMKRGEQSAPRYQKPLKERNPMEISFSIKDPAVAIIQKMRRDAATVKGVSDPKLIYIPRDQAMRAWSEAGLILEPNLEEKTDPSKGRLYQQRANERGMLTIQEAKGLYDHEMGYDRTPEQKADDEGRREQQRQTPGPPIGETAVFKPYLVNVSWVYDSREGKSPKVKYSFEMVVYGIDSDQTAESVREFINDNMTQFVSGAGQTVISLATPEVSEVTLATSGDLGVMDVDGEVFEKRVTDEIYDDRFHTKVEAFFERPGTGRRSSDPNFGYAGTTIRYAWINGRLVMV